ncbi:prepilin-type N-terminal cleavage/methylation domain-containing protein [Metabacillus sp. GX 13764]|uniref:type IV pilus modification PilV family protein n=1 Tax=Metabacillus kandeliae TaxID=2900151 RepID=UPI001E53E068|nr:prepilin-type N-terminal cleavage/methylation domain-containing protein [Metabacillus kandeliae]MCD7032904.1 prepilin-type N-terminal cleavage/methylation domain-containing protein [Metabacillus kandeliae]
MNFRKLLNEKSGFTLIEVLASIVVFSIITFAMLQFFTHAYSYTKKSEDQTLGIYVARNMMNYLEKQSFSNLKTRYQDPLKDGDSLRIGADRCNDKMPGTGEPVFSYAEGRNAAADCARMFSMNINNQIYKVDFTIEKKKNWDETKKKYLLPVKVAVTWGNQTAELGGYVTSEKIR